MIPKGWRTYKLGEIAEIIGGGTPSTTNEEYWNGTIPWLTPRDLTNYNFKYISKGDRSITERGLNNSSARMLPMGAVLLTSRAPIGYLAIAETPVCTNQGFKSLITDDTKVDNQFLYYLLKNNIEQIKSFGTGTTFAEVSGNILKGIEFEFPEYKAEQSQIASILSSLDDKIELNLQMNKTLEAIAQAIFKEWFVDFRFPGFDGELVDGMPKGWRKGHLSDILDLQYGKALKSDDRRQGSYPVIGSSGVVGLHDTFHVKGPGIVIGRKGTIGKVIWIDENFFPIDTTFFIKDLLGASSLYYHFFLLRNQSFQKISSDSAVPGLNKNEALRNYAIVPQVEIVNRYNEIAKPLFERMNLINIENNTLTQLRDSILPKLMTGKIRVL